MGKVFMIADTHFCDKNIALFESRPDNVDELIRENWNNTVSDEDTVYILGDFCLSSMHVDNIKPLIRSLKGKLCLIAGNHDSDSVKQAFRACGWPVYEMPIVLDDFWILSHKPKYVTMNSPYANVFADVHGNPMYRTVSPRSYCVSVERINYTPIEFETIKKAVRESIV